MDEGWTIGTIEKEMWGDGVLIKLPYYLGSLDTIYIIYIF
jgi:hypothetical protein